MMFTCALLMGHVTSQGRIQKFEKRHGACLGGDLNVIFIWPLGPHHMHAKDLYCTS